MAATNRHAQLCKLRDAFGQLRISLIDLSRDVWNLEQAVAAQPESTRQELITTESPTALRHSYGLARTAYRHYQYSALVASKLLTAAAPWLPQLAANYGEGEVRFWAGDAVRLVNWKTNSTVRNIDGEEADEHHRKLAEYCLCLDRLCNYTRPEPEPVPGKSITQTKLSGSKPAPATPTKKATRGREAAAPELANLYRCILSECPKGRRVAEALKALRDRRDITDKVKGLNLSLDGAEGEKLVKAAKSWWARNQA